MILYDPSKDDVELVDKYTFDEVILNSPKATIMEFFAHWCGHCQRFAPHWKELAADTKLWHDKVIRVAAVDCALKENDDICLENQINMYPTFAFFKPYSINRVGFKLSNTMSLKTNEEFMKEMISFIESIPNKPPAWPMLDPYRSDNLDDLFTFHPNLDYALMIFESPISYTGKMIMLDFSPYSDKILIRRVTPDINSNLFKSFHIPTDIQQPIIYVIINDAGSIKRYQKLETFTETIKLRTGKNEVFDENGRFEEALISNHKNDIRFQYAKSIVEFFKYMKIVPGNELNKLINSALEDQFHVGAETKKSAIKKDFSHYNLNMVDLESGLSYMLRQEIPRKPFIKGGDLIILKRWIDVLAKYFPGRKPVRNFLKLVSEKLKMVTYQLPIQEWKNIMATDTENVYLPDNVEFRHCKGSNERYRGYPCSLWMIFHVLTVSHINLAKLTPKPFENFVPYEVLEALRGYVQYYFGCSECSGHFVKATEDYKNNITKPFDEILYLWRVHNIANKRLAGDTTEDPEHPKIQFPSIDKCPECYINETELSEPQVLNYLLQFYGTDNIEGVRELNEARKKGRKTSKIHMENMVVSAAG